MSSCSSTKWFRSVLQSAFRLRSVSDEDEQFVTCAAEVVGPCPWNTFCTREENGRAHPSPPANIPGNRDEHGAVAGGVPACLRPGRGLLADGQQRRLADRRDSEHARRGWSPWLQPHRH